MKFKHGWKLNQPSRFDKAMSIAIEVLSVMTCFGLGILFIYLIIFLGLVFTK